MSNPADDLMSRSIHNREIQRLTEELRTVKDALQYCNDATQMMIARHDRQTVELIAERDALKKQNADLLRKIDMWVGDLEAIEDDDLPRDPQQTVALVITSMNKVVEAADLAKAALEGGKE